MFTERGKPRGVRRMAEGEAITGQEGKVVEETATAGADGGILHPPTGRV